MFSNFSYSVLWSGVYKPCKYEVSFYDSIVFCSEMKVSVVERYIEFVFLLFDMYMSYGWGSPGENVTSERKNM